MRTGASQVVAVVLAALLVAGGAAAWALGGRGGGGVAPSFAPRDIPATGPGSGVVELSADAAAHPSGGAVQSQLQRYFDAINTRSYPDWVATVVPARAQGQPEAAWNEAYASTRDGTIRVDRIDPGPGDVLLVRLRFVSTQDVADAPPEVPAGRICWHSTYPMTGAPPRIDATRGGSSVAAAC